MAQQEQQKPCDVELAVMNSRGRIAASAENKQSVKQQKER